MALVLSSTQEGGVFMRYAWKWLSRNSETPGLFGNITIITFVLAQVLDGVFTNWGVGTWGLMMEGNPLVVLLFEIFGVNLVLPVVKLMGIGCGLFIYLYGLHNVVATLTTIYLVFAVLPWTYLFLTS